MGVKQPGKPVDPAVDIESVVRDYEAAVKKLVAEGKAELSQDTIRTYLNYKEFMHLREATSENVDVVDSRKVLLPKVSTYIQALVVPAHLRDTILGDREEILTKDIKRFGLRRAIWLYRMDTVTAVWCAFKSIFRWSVLMNLGGAIARWFT